MTERSPSMVLSVERLSSFFISTFNVLLRGPSSFFAMSNFIITSRSTVLASVLAHDAFSASSPPSGSGTSDASLVRRRRCVCRNSARFDASFRARFRARSSEMDLLICQLKMKLQPHWPRCEDPLQLVNEPPNLFRHGHNLVFALPRDVREDLWNLVVHPTAARPSRLLLSHYRTSSTLELKRP